MDLSSLRTTHVQLCSQWEDASPQKQAYEKWWREECCVRGAAYRGVICIQCIVYTRPQKRQQPPTILLYKPPTHHCSSSSALPFTSGTKGNSWPASMAASFTGKSICYAYCDPLKGLCARFILPCWLKQACTPGPAALALALADRIKTCVP